MAEAVVNLLIRHLAPLLIDEFKLLGGVRQQVVQIHEDLRSMAAFLKDAETRQDSEEGVNEWVTQVRELAFDLEDVLDEFLLRMGAPHPPGFTGFLCSSTRFIKQLKARHQIATQIQDIKLQIGVISQRRANLSFKACNQDPSSSSSVAIDPRVSSLYVKESELVGIDTIRNELMKRLTDGESNLTVISVVGEGGVGKTTLVRKVYESQGVKARFSCYAWITVSQSFDVKKILKGLIKQHYKRMEEPMPKGIDTMDYEELVETLREYLAEKRYVVILDDIWGLDVWPLLKCVFPENEESSRIIVTTRNHQVASSCTDSHKNVYPFLPLIPSDAWDLFCKKAFGLNKGGTCPPHLDELGKNIVKRCGGLPLAIVAIGGLLSKKRMILSEWELVYRSLGTEIVINDTLKSMSRILWLSYDDLPYHLKSCFLYFSNFPEDYSVKCAKLTRMWVAEGFVKAEVNRRLEEIAEANLNELVARSLIQVSEVDFFGRVERCRVHDLIRDLIVRKSVEENFSMPFAQANTGLIQVKARRLSICKEERFVVSGHDSRFSSVRSVFMVGVSGENLPSLLSSFRLLKVLTLKGIYLDRFPSEIVNLFHLRYLNMRRIGIKEIPNSIGKLQNLQTLDLKYTYVKELPKGILKLKHLRHLLVGAKIFRSGVKLPTGIGRLNCLEKLFYIEVKNSEVIKELGKLTQLRRLGIKKMTDLRRQDVESLCDSISNMNQLQSLCVGFQSEEPLGVSSLSKYTLPHLRSIQLAGPLQNLTDLKPLFPNLLKLTLIWSNLRDDPLKSLQYLQNLAFLHLWWFAYKGEELSCEGGGFPSLRVLYIVGLDELRCVRFEEGAIPLLEELSITDCGNLEMVPVGIQHLTSLKDLDLGRNSDKLEDIIIRSEGKIGPHQMDIDKLEEIRIRHEETIGPHQMDIWNLVISGEKEKKNMAEAGVNLLIEHLAPLLVDEFKLLGGVRQQVAQIYDDLRSMTAFLKDAETRQKL